MMRKTTIWAVKIATETMREEKKVATVTLAFWLTCTLVLLPVGSEDEAVVVADISGKL